MKTQYIRICRTKQIEFLVINTFMLENGLRGWDDLAEKQNERVTKLTNFYQLCL